MIEDALHLEAKLFKGFADPSRLGILETILTGPKTVSQIVTETGLSQPNTSAHLSCLMECGLIAKEKKGREVFYRISMDEVIEILNMARKTSKKKAKEIYNCTKY